MSFAHNLPLLEFLFWCNSLLAQRKLGRQSAWRKIGVIHVIDPLVLPLATLYN